MIQVVVSPQSVLEIGITVEIVDNVRFFKFTEALQDRLEELLEKNKLGDLTSEESEELTSIGELDRLFTHLNSLLLPQ